MVVNLLLTHSCTDIEFLWNTLKDLIIYAISLHTPTVWLKYRHQPQWFTSISVHHKLRKIHSLSRKCKQHPTHHKINRLYRRSRITTTSRHQISYRINFGTTLVRKFAKSKNSSIFKYIKGFVKSSDLSASLTYEFYINVTSDANMCNAFKNFFHSLFCQNYILKSGASNDNLMDYAVNTYRKKEFKL